MPASAQGAGVEQLVVAFKDQVAHYRAHLPDLDLSAYAIDDLSGPVPEGGDLSLLQLRLQKTMQAMTRAAKIKVLEKIKAEAQTLEGSPTDKGNYAPRRQLVLTYDFVERAAGRRPIYPKELGRPFVTLVEQPAPKDLQACDGYLRFLARIPPPKPISIGSLGSGGGLGGSGGGEEEGSTSTGPRLGPPVGGRPSSRPSGSTSAPLPPQPENRGWMLVRYYIFAVLGALVLLYLTYLAYTAAKGGKNFMSYVVDMIRRRGRLEPDLEEDPFKKGMKLFGRNKYREAIEVFEKLAGQARQSSQPARYYLVLSGLKLGRPGLVSRECRLLDPEKFSPDELYRLALALEEAVEVKLAIQFYEHIWARDSSFRDVGSRLDKLRKDA